MDSQQDILLYKRIAELEAKVDFLLKHFDLEAEEQASRPAREPRLPDVEELLLKGNKHGAIQLYRTRTGAGLAEAKDAVEKMERGLRE